MASVRLKGSSSHWFACFKLPTGAVSDKGHPLYRRVQRSTGTADQSRAQQLSISYERAAVLAGEKRWTENSARKFLREISAVSGVSIGEVEGTDIFLKRWLASRVSSLGLRSRERYQQVVDQFLEFLGPSAPAPISEVTVKRVTEFRDSETAAGKAGETVNKSLAVLAQAFDEAKLQQLIELNPARGINMKGSRRRAEKRRPFTFDQFRELVVKTHPKCVIPGNITHKNHTVHPEWQTFILFLGYTGGRQQEVAKIKWEQIDFSRHRLWLDRSKTSDEHALPMHASLERHLRKLAPSKKKLSGYVMPHLASLRRTNLSQTFRVTILPRIGIVQPYGDKPGKGRKLAEYSLHSLRHSLSTWLEEAGVSEMMRMRIVGHEDEDVSRGYTHTELAAAAAELAKVPAV